MAEVVLADRLEAAGLADRVRLSSAGTGGWHVGDPMDERAATTLADAGYDPTRHRARQLDGSWFAAHDALLVMDADNLREVSALAPTDDDRARVLLFRTFDPGRGSGEDIDVPDPYFGGADGFARVLTVVERTADGLVDALRSRLTAPTAAEAD
ncbi:MAG: low molecular weight phosphotyrosine protein phosphatase [Nocardioidaceae bacterium]|nr:low molecular weight phosphotyrosine protein phosphatase [Nocardioidaceae bacterium]NUS52695.1 low molecular weight phosphotyrosine protein phosphatase [Nocardioidaceae bacterium]